MKNTVGKSSPSIMAGAVSNSASACNAMF
jgi:hypothetical protein